MAEAFGWEVWGNVAGRNKTEDKGCTGAGNPEFPEIPEIPKIKV